MVTWVCFQAAQKRGVFFVIQGEDVLKIAAYLSQAAFWVVASLRFRIHRLSQRLSALKGGSKPLRTLVD